MEQPVASRAKRAWETPLHEKLGSGGIQAAIGSVNEYWKSAHGKEVPCPDGGAYASTPPLASSGLCPGAKKSAHPHPHDS